MPVFDEGRMFTTFRLFALGHTFCSSLTFGEVCMAWGFSRNKAVMHEETPHVIYFLIT